MACNADFIKSRLNRDGAARLYVLCCASVIVPREKNSRGGKTRFNGSLTRSGKGNGSRMISWRARQNKSYRLIMRNNKKRTRRQGREVKERENDRFFLYSAEKTCSPIN